MSEEYKGEDERVVLDGKQIADLIEAQDKASSEQVTEEIDGISETEEAILLVRDLLNKFKEASISYNKDADMIYGWNDVVSKDRMYLETQKKIVEELEKEFLASIDKNNNLRHKAEEITGLFLDYKEYKESISKTSDRVEKKLDFNDSFFDNLTDTETVKIRSLIDNDEVLLDWYNNIKNRMSADIESKNKQPENVFKKLSRFLSKEKDVSPKVSLSRKDVIRNLYRFISARKDESSKKYLFKLEDFISSVVKSK